MRAGRPGVGAGLSRLYGLKSVGDRWRWGGGGFGYLLDFVGGVNDFPLALSLPFTHLHG